MQAIRSYVRDVDPEQLRSDMGAGAADITEVVSDVREQLPGLNAPPQLEPEQARFRLFDSITAFLKNAAQRKPLVLVLNDLHWADHPSLLLLEFMARELANARVMIIGTYRDVELSRQHPLSRTLGELTRERLFQRVLLRGLDQEDVGRFVELVSGVNPPRGMVEGCTGKPRATLCSSPRWYGFWYRRGNSPRMIRRVRFHRDLRPPAGPRHERRNVILGASESSMGCVRLLGGGWTGYPSGATRA